MTDTSVDIPKWHNVIKIAYKLESHVETVMLYKFPNCGSKYAIILDG